MKFRLNWPQNLFFVLGVIGAGTAFALEIKDPKIPILHPASEVKTKRVVDSKPVLHTATGYLESMQSGISTTDPAAIVSYSVTTRTGKTVTLQICKALPKEVRERLDLTSNTAIGNWVKVTYRQNRNGTRCLLDLRLS